ncbi:MAG: hypothetical protein ABEJ42_02725 [Halobacteriaceae archaeon]
MAPSRRRLLGTLAGTALTGAAGCGGGGDGTSSPAEGTTSGPDATTAGSGGAATVAVAAHPDLGEILVDGDGLTLYMFDADDRGAGTSSCTDGCRQSWPPLTAEGDPAAGGE